MMREVWLQSNRRVILASLILATLLLGVGLLLGSGLTGSATALRGTGAVIGVLAAALAALLIWQLRRPRIGRRADDLLFYMRSGPPERVPIELVEGFLLGQGASYLRAKRPAASQVRTVVVRLADRAKEYAQREVRPALGSWCNNYVTIRGTWCEPLSLALVNQLNARLAEAHAEIKRGRGRS